MGDGGLILRFTNFRTSNGPNVHVYLVAADDAKDSETLQHAGFIDLGPIKGNIGDQNYALGSDVDLSKYRAVSVWSQRFSVNFGAARLKPDHVVRQNRILESRRGIRMVANFENLAKLAKSVVLRPASFFVFHEHANGSPHALTEGVLKG